MCVRSGEKGRAAYKKACFADRSRTKRKSTCPKRKVAGLSQTEPLTLGETMPAKNKSVSTRAPGRTSRRSSPWPAYVIMPVCGLLLISGFFFAGRQHFVSMDYGIKNSRLRKQIEDLEA